MPEAQLGCVVGSSSERYYEIGLEVGIERVLLGHCVVEVVYDCR